MTGRPLEVVWDATHLRRTVVGRGFEATVLAHRSLPEELQPHRTHLGGEWCWESSCSIFAMMSRGYGGVYGSEGMTPRYKDRHDRFLSASC